MNSEQEKNLQDIKTHAMHLIESKYVAGAREHGGNLKDMSRTKLLDEAINEAIDMVVYLLTLKQNEPRLVIEGQVD